MAQNPRRKGGCCSAFGCSMRLGTNLLSEIKMFHFPRDPVRRAQWALALRRKDWYPTNYSVLCSRHFVEGKPSHEKEHPDYVPSVFNFSVSSSLKGKTQIERFERNAKRKKLDADDSQDNSLEDCFDREKFGGSSLKPTTVPTIFNFAEQQKTIQRVRRTPKRKPRIVNFSSCSSISSNRFANKESQIVSFLNCASNPSSRMERWAGRVALVTGASVGIGEHICRMLVEHGMVVIGCARRVEKIQAISDSLKSAPGKLYPVRCDLAKEDEILNMFETIREEYERIDVLINNAGFSTKNSLLDGSTEQWKSMLDVNVLALCICTREAVKLMQEKGIDDGQIIHISSMSGHRVPPNGMSFYAGTKFMVRTLAEGLRTELKAQKSHIRVACVSPGLVETEFAYTMLKDANKASELYQSITCLKPEDVADAVLYILSTKPHVDVNDILIRPVEQMT